MEAGVATGGQGSGEDGRKILWALEKSEKELKIRKIKIQRRRLRQSMDVTKTLDTRYSICKGKSPTYSKFIHTIVFTIKYKKTGLLRSNEIKLIGPILLKTP